MHFLKLISLSHTHTHTHTHTYTFSPLGLNSGPLMLTKQALYCLTYTPVLLLFQFLDFVFSLMFSLGQP
jgi:hypothetical protein